MNPAFFDELEKIGFGFADMRKVLRLSKSKTLKLPPQHLPVGTMAIPASTVPQQRAALAQAVASGQVPATAVAPAQKMVAVGGGKMLMPKGGVVRQLEGMGMPKGMVKGKERMATESLLRGHELDELALGARKLDPQYALKATHMSPDVILRERNRLLTMPQAVKGPVSEVMTPLRQFEAPVLERATRGVSGQGLQYGAGPRLSRHARKRITKRMKEITALPETPGLAELARQQMGG